GLEERLQTAAEFVWRQARDVLLVHPIELLGVEHSVTAGDAVEIEGFGELIEREQLAVAAARRPAEKREEVDHRLRQVTLTRILHHRRRAVTLAEALLVGAED